ncbi:MAG: type II secretion system protein GspM [Steroidobacteraceae bacterium]
MIERLQTWYDALAARERRIVLIGGIAAAVLLVLAILLPLQQRTSAAESRITQKSADLQWLRSMTAPLQAAAATGNRRPGSARQGPGGPGSAGPGSAGPGGQRQSLVALVDRQARATGLGESLVNSQPSGDGGLSVRLENASFDTLVALLARLADQDGVHIENATIEAAKTTGHVNASLVLRGG